MHTTHPYFSYLFCCKGLRDTGELNGVQKAMVLFLELSLTSQKLFLFHSFPKQIKAGAFRRSRTKV
jgi:hypothetical protein